MDFCLIKVNIFRFMVLLGTDCDAIINLELYALGRYYEKLAPIYWLLFRPFQ